MPTALSAADAQDSEQISACRLLDSFAAPWQSANERFEDTSFGVALNALHRVKESWKKKGLEVRMSAYDRSQGVADSAPDAYADAGPAAFGKSYSADRAIQDARGDEGEARSHKLRAWRVLRIHA